MKLEFNGFNERLEDLIYKSGKTHKEIASETGISKHVIDSYTSKNGSSNPSAENAIRLAVVLGTTAEYLMTGKSPSSLVPLTFEQRMIVENLSLLSPRDKETIKSVVTAFVRAR